MKVIQVDYFIFIKIVFFLVALFFIILWALLITIIKIFYRLNDNINYTVLTYTLRNRLLLKDCRDFWKLCSNSTLEEIIKESEDKDHNFSFFTMKAVSKIKWIINNVEFEEGLTYIFHVGEVGKKFLEKMSIDRKLNRDIFPEDDEPNVYDEIQATKYDQDNSALTKSRIIFDDKNMKRIFYEAKQVF